MSRLSFSLDDSVLRSQLNDSKQYVDSVSRQKIDRIVSFPRIKLLALLLVHVLVRARIIEVAEKLGVNRRTAGRYLDELDRQDGLLGYEIEAGQELNSHPAKNFFVLHESTKIVLSYATGEGKAIELNNPKKNGASPTRVAIGDLENMDETGTEGKLLSLEDILRFRDNLQDMPPTGQKIYYLLNDKPQSTKQLAQQIGCEKSTVNKYLKRFFDLGIAKRNITSSYGAGRGEHFYFLNPVIPTTLLEHKNQLQPSVPLILTELENGNDDCTKNTAVSASTIEICQSSEGFIMNTQSSQQEPIGQSVDTNVAERFDPVDKLNEFAALLDQVDKTEKELRTLLGSKAENLIARLKSKNS